MIMLAYLYCSEAYIAAVQSIAILYLDNLIMHLTHILRSSIFLTFYSKIGHAHNFCVEVETQVTTVSPADVA